MTDLERLWDDYPAKPAPTAEIVRAGRSAAATTSGRSFLRRPAGIRPALAAGLATSLVGAFVAGAIVGSSGGGSDRATPGGEALPSHVAFQADLQAAEDCDELLQAYVDRALPLVTAWGWGVSWYDHDGSNFALDVERLTAVSAQRSRAQSQRQVSSETGTNVQESGVDEPDVVKTNGTLLVRVQESRVVVYDVAGEQVERVGAVHLPRTADLELLLDGDTVIALGTDTATKDRRGTRVQRVSLADPAEPTVLDDVSYDSTLLSARQHDDVVRLVMSTGLPDLDFVEPTGNRGHGRAERRNRQIVEESQISDWLPTMTVGDDNGALLDCTDVAIPDEELSLDTVSVVGFATSDPTTVRAIGLAGATDIAYESRDQLFLAASPSWRTGWGMCRCIVSHGRGVRGGVSHLFGFDLDGINATHVASGRVKGAIADRWSIDEYDGVLRLAVGPTSETGNFNSIVTFIRDGDELLEHGRLDRIGPREDIKAVRWMDHLAIVVTFRQVDPLYAVDLTDDADPTLLGELKIPGFSEYLHPLGSYRMVGLGRGPVDGGWGAQAGLFDVSDLTDVRRIDVHDYRRHTTAVAGADPRAFTWLPHERTVLTVIAGRKDGARAGWISVLRLENGRFQERMVHVEYGSDVDKVRTVPLPDGRVVLVTGTDAAFFPLSGD